MEGEGRRTPRLLPLPVPRVLVVKVKAAERVAAKDLSGLRKLRDALGPRLLAGIALTTGSRSYTHEDRLHVMPIDRLWTPVP